MAPKIKLGYDPKDAKKGLGDLEKQMEATSKSADKLGKEAVETAKEIGVLSKQTTLSSQAMKKFEGDFSAAQRALKTTTTQAAAATATASKGMADLGSQTGNAASAVRTLANVTPGATGEIAGYGATALESSDAVYKLGQSASALNLTWKQMAVGGAAAGVTLLAVTSILKDLKKEWEGGPFDTKGGVFGLDENPLLLSAKKRGQSNVQNIRRLEEADREFEAEQTRKFKDRQKGQFGGDPAELFEARKEFVALEKQREEQARQAAFAAEASALKLADVRHNIVRFAEMDAELIEKGKTLTGNTLEIEKKREKLLTDITGNQSDLNELKRLEQQLIAENARAETEAARVRERELAERQRLEKQAHDERMRQIEKEQREAEKKLLKDASDLSAMAGGGSKGRQITEANPLPVKVIDDPGVIRGRDQANPFQTGGLAGGLMGRQSAMAGGAQAFQQRNVAQPGNIVLGNAQRHARGDFSMDRRGLTVDQMRGAAPSGPAAGAAQGAGQASGLTDLQQAVADQPGAQAAITRAIVEERKRLNKPGGTFRQAKPGGAQEGSQAEIERAIEQLATAQFENAVKEGRVGEKVAEAFLKMLEIEADQATRTDNLEKAMDQIQKELGVRKSNSRKKAQQAGRSP